MMRDLWSLVMTYTHLDGAGLNLAFQGEFLDYYPGESIPFPPSESR